MISNERPSPYGRPARPRRDYFPSGLRLPRPAVVETTLQEVQIQVERKLLRLTLKENARGRFLRITEDGGQYRNTVIIPATGLEEFKKLIEELVKAAATMPPQDDDAVGNR